jgi:phage terminase large subunit-like protein
MWLPDNSETWLEYETWKACARNINWNDYKGKKAIAGLDCSKVRDLTSFVIVFKNDDGTYTIQPHFWIPGESARARELTDRVPWTKWNSAGHCKFSNKPITDMAIIKRDIEELCALYDIEQVAYDQAGVIMEAHDLYNNSNVPMTQYSQTDLAIGPPSKFFESLVLDGRLIHDDNPVMNLCLMNTTIETNKFSNIRPRRIRNKACIDGVMATIFALGLYCNDLMGADTSIQPGIYYAE